MNRKGQVSIGQALLGVFLFAILIIGGMNAYLGNLYENDVSVPSTIDEAKFEAMFGKYDGTGKSNITTALANTSSSIHTKSKVPFFGTAIDFFAIGSESISKGYDSIGFVSSYVIFAQDNTVLGTFLPSSFWGLLLSIFTIILVLVVVGALWRYNLTK